MSTAKYGIPVHEIILIQLPSGDSPPGFQIDVGSGEGWVIGRSDSKSSYIPDIDLASYNGLEKGVSRRHAAFVRYQGKVHILDLNSVNGTYLNGEKLVSEVPYLLNNGDEITLASLNLKISI
jgi:pSer/pThr/pTyr-binding forkhead associated (FHA) protein